MLRCYACHGHAPHRDGKRTHIAVTGTTTCAIDERANMLGPLRMRAITREDSLVTGSLSANVLRRIRVRNH